MACTDSVSGMIVILDQLHVQECIAFNRAMRYRYDLGYIATLSLYDDKTMFPQCAGQFARPTTGNVIKGIRWMLGQGKPRQQMVLAVLGNVTPLLATQIQKALGAMKDLKLVLVSTSPVTFGGVKAAVNICGPPSMLACFDGTDIIPSKLATKAIVKTADDVDKDKAILLGKPQPWVY